MSDEVLIKVDNVSKKFCRTLKRSLWYGVQDVTSEILCRQGGQDELRPGEFWATNDVSFELRRGECLGLIGRNGAGKTTLLRMLNGLIKPDKGQIEMCGRVGSLIALGAGFNPVLTGRENIYVNGSVLGLRKREIDSKLEEIIDFAEIEEFVDSPVQTYSSGMQVRLGFAVATALEPDVLLLDEVLAVGDIAFRSKCFQRIGKLISRCAVVFVSHDMVQMSRICDHSLYLKKGMMAGFGSTSEILDMYSKDSTSPKGEMSVALHSSVKSFKCTPSKIQIGWGDSYEVSLEINSDSWIKSGLALFTLLDGESSVAQAEFTSIFNDCLGFNKEVNAVLGPLHLKSGTYTLAVTVLDETKKNTLVHALNLCEISFLGHKGYGVSYQVPCEKLL